MKAKDDKKKHSLGYWVSYYLDNEKTSKFMIPLLATVLSILASFLLMLALGKDPFMAIAGFLKGSGLLPKAAYASGQNMLTDFLSFLEIMAPMLLASLGIVVAMKAGLFNIGVAGQMMAAGFISTILVGYSGLDAYLAKPLVLLVGMSVGGLVGAFIGFLKYKFNIHEVVTSIMLNYIISFVISFFINTYYADPISRSSMVTSAASRLTIKNVDFMNLRIDIPLGILVAFLLVFVVRFVLDRTVTGFEMKAVGKNRENARYAGINVGKNMVLAMFFSGLLAGLAGVALYQGVYNTIVPRQLSGLGFDSIAVALVGNISPLGCIYASFLITVFQKGSVYMSSTMAVPRDVASVITAVLLLFSATRAYIEFVARKQYDKYAEKEGSHLALHQGDPIKADSVDEKEVQE